MKKYYTFVAMLVITLVIRFIANHLHSGIGNFIAIYSLISCLLGLIPAKLAQKKGSSFIKWWIFGWVLFIPAMILQNQRRQKNIYK